MEKFLSEFELGMKKLLLTGATGFVGRNILPLLSQQYEVTTCGRSVPNMIQVDLSKDVPNLPGKYDVVLHAAGKVHTIPRSEVEMKEFDDVNCQGTINLCSALEKVGGPETFIFLSTVAVYGCERGVNIDEYHELNPKTPYAISKKKAEDYLLKWSREHSVRLSILRPSLIAGPNPPGNLQAMIKGISTGRYISIDGGKARKSVLMVDDLANLIPLLEENPGIYNVCSDEQPSFRELERCICKQIGKQMPMTIPYWMIKSIAYVGDFVGDKFPINSNRLSKLVSILTFSNEKAKTELGWMPLNVMENFKIK